VGIASAGELLMPIRPQDVFTPRAAAVNLQTYVSRPDLEDRLRQSLGMPKHVVIHGESGTGKSWLYKKVLAEQGYYFEVANMGLCKSSGSIAEVLLRTVCRETTSEIKSTHEMNIGVPAIAGGKVQREEKTFLASDPFYLALDAVSTRAGAKPSCLVFDNLEQVTTNNNLVQELAGLLLLVDDDRYAALDVKILLVGTSNEIRAIINSSDFSNTIANRLVEVPEVARLTEEQSQQLAQNGLINLLGCEFEDGAEFQEKFWRLLSYHSDRIPQFLQELSLYVALSSQKKDWRLDSSVFLDGTREWIRSALVKDVARVEANVNSKGTKIGRRNQVLYCLGACVKYDFNRADIEEILKKEFPKSSENVALNVSQILSDLLKGEHRIITRSPKSNFYRFLDPKFRIVLRWMLVKKPGVEEITHNTFDHALSLWSKPSQNS
jgi:hypothetical protein